MARNALLSTALTTAFAASLCAATPAHAIDPGCYPADVVRKATWLAEGPEKQFTIIVGERTTDTKNGNFFTASADGKVGYNIENDGTGVSDGKLCIRAKYQNVRVNIEFTRPSWLSLPAGSLNDRYIADQERRGGVKVIFGAATVVRGKNGREYAGPQLLVTKSDQLIHNMVTGAVITNDRTGDGDALMALMNMRTNANFDALLKAQKPVQTASLGVDLK